MKPDIHPKYYPNARVICACGHVWTTGATQPEIRVDVCSNCHPFYTGEQRIVDTAGRVDRFRMRLAQKREKKVEKHRKEKFRIVGPDEPAPVAADSEVPAPAAAVAEAENIVNEPAVAPAAVAAAPETPEAEPELLVRTVVEGGETGPETVIDEEERPGRRAKARKPRAAGAEGEAAAAEKPARKPRPRKPAPVEGEAKPDTGAAPAAEGSDTPA